MDETVTVRELRRSEKACIEALFKRSLGIVDLIVFTASFEDALKASIAERGGCLIAEIDDRIVGLVCVKIKQINGKSVGLIDALVSDRDYRGRGIAGALVDEAVSWLSNRKCETLYATVDRYNSSSWNTFMHRGFSIVELPRMLRDHGLGTLRLWMAELYFIGYGTFFIRKQLETDDRLEMSDGWHFLLAWAGLFIIWFVQALRRGEPLMTIPLILTVTGISLFVPELSQMIVAKRAGRETVFKSWDSGILFSLLLSILGSFFPAYGSTYVKKLDYRYDLRKMENGIFFTVGPTVSLSLTYAFWLLSSQVADSPLVIGLKAGYTMNLVNTLFNLFPMQAAGGLVWDGRKILSWNRTIWLSLTAGLIALILLDIWL